MKTEQKTDGKKRFTTMMAGISAEDEEKELQQLEENMKPETTIEQPKIENIVEPDVRAKKSTITKRAEPEETSYDPFKDVDWESITDKQIYKIIDTTGVSLVHIGFRAHPIQKATLHRYMKKEMRDRSFTLRLCINKFFKLKF